MGSVLGSGSRAGLTRKSMEINEDEKKIRSLLELEGVGIPVCSAILTMIYPVEYCVIDYRAWRVLKWYMNAVDFSSYGTYSSFLDSYDSRTSVEAFLIYLKNILQIANNWNMTARKVEMALWKFDEMEGKDTI